MFAMITSMALVAVLLWLHRLVAVNWLTEVKAIRIGLLADTIACFVNVIISGLVSANIVALGFSLLVCAFLTGIGIQDAERI
jgi:hypothetical protein